MIGIESKTKNNYLNSALIKENLNKNPIFPIRFGIHQDFVPTIIAIEKYNYILTGDMKGIVVQYLLDGHTGKVIKNYGDIGIGQLYSSAKLGRLAVFGGNYSEIVFIDTLTKQILFERIKVAIKVIYSLEFCIMDKKNNKVLLSISGCGSDYSDNKTDLLDVSAICKSLNLME